MFRVAFALLIFVAFSTASETASAEFWGSIEDQWYDLWLDNPRDLGANGTHCKSHCLSSCDIDSLNNIARTAANKVYGKNRTRFPWAQRGRRWDYIGA